MRILTIAAVVVVLALVAAPTIAVAAQSGYQSGDCPQNGDGNKHQGPPSDGGYKSGDCPCENLGNQHQGPPE